MSRIVELVQRLCPDGVEYKPLGEITKKQTAKNKGEVCNLAYSITQAGLVPTSEFFKEAKVTSSDTSGYRIVKRGWFVYSPSRIDVGSINYLRDASEVIVSPINVVFSVDKNRIDNSYLLSYLKSSRGMWLIEGKRQGIEGTGRKNLPYERFAEIEIPIPPLKVQQEIVRILDAFTELEANLQRELDARKRQYGHYRDELLSFLSEAKGVRLGDLGEFYGGLSGKTKADFKEGANASFIPYTNVFNNMVVDFDSLTPVEVRPDEKQNAVHKGDVLFTTSSETPDECAMASIVKEEPKGAVYLNSFCRGFRPRTDTGVDIDFLKHLLHSFEMRQKLTRTANGVTRFNVSKKLLLDVVIPIPSLETQKEIVSKLDAMLDLQDNLQRQIELTHRQYEHYRDVLLDLPRKES